MILAALCGTGIVNLAFGRWQPATFEIAVGGGFFSYFSAQWAHLNNTARQRRNPDDPCAPTASGR